MANSISDSEVVISSAIEVLDDLLHLWETLV